MSNDRQIYRSCPSHCCPVHGCKYAYENCPVKQGRVKPEFPDNNGCEVCEYEAARDRAYSAGGEVVATYQSGFEDGVKAVEDRMAEAASKLSDNAAYRIARMAGSSHPCPLDDCNLSVEEHHRLAYGILAENKELKRRIQELENG